MKDLPAFCHFWRMSPGEVRGLRVDEYRALLAYQERHQRQERDEMKRLELLAGR